MSECYLCKEYHGIIHNPKFKGNVGRTKPGERTMHIYMALTTPGGQPVWICPDCLAKHLSRCVESIKAAGPAISTGEYEYIY